MADKKISELANAAPLGVGDAFEIVQGGESKQASGSQVLALVADSVNPRFNATAGRQGMELDGVSGSVTIPLDAAKRPAYGLGDFSVGGWVYLARLGVVQRLFGPEVGSVGSFDSFALASNIIGLRKDGGTAPTNSYSSGVELKLGWQHILFVRKDEATKLYYNGVEAYSVADVNSYERPFNRLGTRGTSNPLQGAFADVIDLNYALPATTTDGITGVAERYRDGRFLTSGDLLKDVGVFFDTPLTSPLPSNRFIFGSSAGSSIAWGQNGIGPAGDLRDDCLVWTFDTDNPNGYRLFFRFNNGAFKYSHYRATIEVYVPAGQTINGFALGRINGNISDSALPVWNHGENGANSAGEWVAVKSVILPKLINGDFDSMLSIQPSVGNTLGADFGDTIAIRAVSFEGVGATLALESEGIQAERGQWLDSSNPPKHSLQAATGTKPLLRLSTSITVVEGVDASSAVFLFGARNILTDDWTVESVEVFNDGAGSAEIDLEFSNGTTHVNLTGATTTIAAGTSKRLQVVNGKPTAYNRIRATGDSGADDMRFILALKPRR